MSLPSISIFVTRHLLEKVQYCHLSASECHSEERDRTPDKNESENLECKKEFDVVGSFPGGCAPDAVGGCARAPTQRDPFPWNSTPLLEVPDDTKSEPDHEQNPHMRILYWIARRSVILVGGLPST